MKKKYSAPEILFESFTMSTNIAGDCEAKPQTQVKYSSCGIDFGGYIVFAVNYNGCSSMQVDFDDEYGGICYHVPSENNNIFNS